MKLLLQVGLVFAICLMGEIVAALLPFAFPGTIISLVLLFLLLVLRVVRVDHIQKKADFLLKNMAFFFIPAGVGILGQVDAVKDNLVPLLAVVVITTLLTFGSTALTVQGAIWVQDFFGRRPKKKERSP